MRFHGPGGSARGGYWGRAQDFLSGLLPGTRKDWASKVGDRWRNSAVAIALNWITQSFPEAPPCVKREKADGTEDYVPGHRLLQLLKKPNPWYGPRVLWTGTLISFVCEGNAYWRIMRGNSHLPAQLWYIPHFQIEPQWPEDGSDFITHYAYTVNGVTEDIDPKDIVHFRWGLNPRNVRKGMSPLAAQDRQIAGDNECSTYHAALLENFGIPGLLISQDTDKVSFVDDGTTGNDDAEERFKRILQARTTGDEAGKPIIVPVRVKVDVLGFNPDELGLEKLRTQNLLRVFGAVGLDPMVAGQESNSKTYSNYGEAMTGGWENCILPMMAMLCESLAGLLAEFEDDPAVYVGFDTRKVKALQEDFDALAKRIELLAGGPVISVNEGRLMLGLQKTTDPDDPKRLDRIREKRGTAVPGDAGETMDTETELDSDKGKS